MSDPSSEDAAADAAVWRLLRRQVDGRVPDEVLAAARDALRWRDPDAALAVLVSDSADASPATAASVRGDEQPRLLSFATAEFAIDIEASLEDNGTVSLMGQLAPIGPAEVEADHRLGVLATIADDLGRFSLDGIEPGPVRLRCTTSATGARVHTAWVLLS